jgi:ankyrin repeat protein
MSRLFCFLRSERQLNRVDSYDKNCPELSVTQLSLLSAVRQNDLLAASKILEKQSSEGIINASISRWDSTILMEACYKGHLSMAKLLVSYGAQINQVDLTGNTALLRAATWNHDKIIEWLIMAGQDGFELGSTEWRSNYQRDIMNKENVQAAIVGGQRLIVNTYLVPILDGQNFIPVKDLINLVTSYIF